MTAPTIITNSVHPANESEGIALGTQIYIIFDREVDETTVNSGTFVVSGPETDLVTGPFLTLADDPLRTNDDDFLQSPHYQGVVPGTYTFERLDSSNSPSTIYDHSGLGDKYRTKVIFTPSRPLSPSVQYNILIAGDEDSSDDLSTGITTRTVFDTLVGPILGTGRAEITGGYIGDLDDTFKIKITTGGKLGEAKFYWWRESKPTLKYELTTSGSKQLLTDGIYVQFFTDGTSDIDDFLENGGTSEDWSVIVKPGEALENNFLWSFTTGSGSIVAPPETTSTSLGLGDLDVSQVTEGFRVVEVTPDIRATNLDPLSLDTVLVKFNKNIKEGQDLSTLISVFADAVNGDPSIEALGNLTVVGTINGDTLVLKIG